MAVAFISPGMSGIVTFLTVTRLSMKSAYSGAFVLPALACDCQN